MTETFSEAERDTVYRLIRARRDIRHFRSTPVPTDALLRILEAAHLAPSVGFMQPWNFILVNSVEVRQQIKVSFEDINAAELKKLTDLDRQSLYRQLKLSRPTFFSPFSPTSNSPEHLRRFCTKALSPK